MYGGVARGAEKPVAPSGEKEVYIGYHDPKAGFDTGFYDPKGNDTSVAKSSVTPQTEKY